MSGVYGKAGGLLDSIGFYYTSIPEDMLGEEARYHFQET